MEGWRIVRVFLSPRKTSMAYKIKKRQSKIKIVLHKDICRLGTITNVQTKLNCVRCIDLCQLLLITLLSWNIFFLYQQRILMTNSDPGESSYFAIVSSPTMFFLLQSDLVFIIWGIWRLGRKLGWQSLSEKQPSSAHK